jgi:hypothetical protein
MNPRWIISGGVLAGSMVVAAAGPAQVTASCPAITNATKAGLYVVHGERETAVEGSPQSAARRGDTDWRHLFFEIALAANKLKGPCAIIDWRVEPTGPAPVDAADFGGKLPSGRLTLHRSHGEQFIEGEIEIWVPDDHVAEPPEQFRVVLTSPASECPLPGVVRRYDDQRGIPLFHVSPASLAMRYRLVMTVLDAPEQRLREPSRREPEGKP